MLIIGGTGDLSRRHLLPALTRLLVKAELPEGFTVTLTGREPMSPEECRTLTARELDAHAAHLPIAARNSLVERISFLQAEVRDPGALRSIDAGEPLLIYVATPPAAVPAALEAIRDAGIHRSARIVLDKPFGLSRSSAKALNVQALALVDESNLYRIDHFLYHHVVQELLRWRTRSDPMVLADVLPLAEVDIVWDETRVGQSSLDGGVIRDMIQSHLLLLTAAVTMDAPASLTRADLAPCRLEALRRTAADAGSPAMRARLVRADEADTSTVSSSAPETFVTLTLRSQMARWRGVRFILRAGKGVDQSRRHIEFRLARLPERQAIPFVRLEVLAGKLVIGVDTEASFESVVASDEESPSTRLVRAALVGDDTFTLSSEEPEEAWRIVEPLLQAWERSDAPLPTYAVGASAASILEAGAGGPSA